MTDALRQRDQEFAKDPRECLGFACVASLGAWVATASAWLDMGDGPMVWTSIQAAHPELSAARSACYSNTCCGGSRWQIRLFSRWPMGSKPSKTLAFGGGSGRRWRPGDVFSGELLRHLPHRLDQRTTDWRALYI
jgi:hypothetical protein